MATITGSLANFAMSPMASYAPQITFIPSGPGVMADTSGTYLLASQPYVVIPSPTSGAFQALLTRTDTIRPEAWYEIRIDWLNGEGVPVGTDWVQGRLYVPAEGGTITDLLVLPWNPTLAWVGESLPPGIPTTRSLWLDPVTGLLKMWS